MTVWAGGWDPIPLSPSLGGWEGPVIVYKILNGTGHHNEQNKVWCTTTVTGETAVVQAKQNSFKGHMTSWCAVFVIQPAPIHTPATIDSVVSSHAVTTPPSTDTVGNAAANSPLAFQPTGVRPRARGRAVVERPPELILNLKQKYRHRKRKAAVLGQVPQGRQSLYGQEDTRDPPKSGKRPPASRPARRSANTKRQPPQDILQAGGP